MQCPTASQWSPLVQLLKSVHVAPLASGAVVQPTAGSQSECMHSTVVSVQATLKPARQAPNEQVSAAVQALPSSQRAVLGKNMQPLRGSQESFVQGFLSLQKRASSPTQVPAASQASPPVQAFASLHAAPGITVCSQPVAPQASAVHWLPSSQPAATQASAQHSVPPVQREVRSHTTPRQTALVQPSPAQFSGVHVGYWQPNIASQVPPVLTVQAASVAVCSQADAVHRSTVQPMPSSQLTGVPGRHTPASQRSTPLQASPSAQSESARQPGGASVAASSAPASLSPASVGPASKSPASKGATPASSRRPGTVPVKRGSVVGSTALGTHAPRLHV